MKRHQRLARIGVCGAVFIMSLWSAPTGSVFGRTPDGEDPGGVLAIGEVASKGENVAEARRQALSDALERGVEAHLLRLLGGKAVADQFARFIQELVPAARDEIANYHILSEEEIGGRYRVLVRLRVNEKTLERILDENGFLREEGQPIRVLFLVSQRRSGDEAPAYWWKDPAVEEGLLPLELGLKRAFEAKGFTQASRTLNAPEGEGSENLRRHDLTIKDAAAWGRLCSADVVVLGSGVLSDSMVSIHLRAVDVATGTMVSEQGAQGALDSGLQGEDRIREGIERAARDLSARLAPDIREAVRRVEVPADRLVLTLSGVEGFAQLRQFTRFLTENIPGVESVTQTRFKGDTVTFSVAYGNGPDAFMEALLNGPELPFPVQAQQTEDGEILVTPL